MQCALKDENVFLWRMDARDERRGVAMQFSLSWGPAGWTAYERRWRGGRRRRLCCASRATSAVRGEKQSEHEDEGENGDEEGECVGGRQTDMGVWAEM